ncbi:replicative DNA helicase, partial [Klebsiella pneumoniae]|nr:replicative DNA helicase [Klebsiella pneumoniae]
VIIAARPGMGKTEIALKITEGVASQNVIGSDTKKGVLIFSMEMDSQQIVERQIAGSANLSVSALRNPSRMSDEDWGRVSMGAGNLLGLNVWVVDASKLT